MLKSGRLAFLFCLLSMLLLAGLSVGCANVKAVEAKPMPISALSPTATAKHEITPTTIQPTIPKIQPTATDSILGISYDTTTDLVANPVELPLELQIPSLNVIAPILAVGLTKNNALDAPVAPYGDPAWSAAFWYRGGSIPGDPGTATICGYVINQRGQLEIFGKLKKLRVGDEIIIHVNNSKTDIHFRVDQVELYSIKEISDPAVAAKIYGPGSLSGTGPQPAVAGFSNLTLLACGGNYFNGDSDSRTAIFATRTDLGDFFH